MFLLVHSEGSSCFAYFGALEASKAFPIMLPDVPPLVVPFGGEIQETLKAELTVVALLPSVDSLMENTIRALTKGLPTLITFIGLFSSMYSLMLC